MSKTIDLVIRVTVPVPDGITPEDHCAEAWEEERPLLAVGEPLGEQVEDLLHTIMGASAGDERAAVQSVRLTLEPGREPGRPMTHAEAELYQVGFHAGMAMTMEACADEIGGEAWDSEHLTQGEELVARYVGCADLDDYAEDDAAESLSRFVRLQWNGAHWVSGIPGNAGARIDALAEPKPWDHDDPWGIT